MNPKRSLAASLLVLLAIGDGAVVPRLLTTDNHRPPTLLPVLVGLCALASVAAAYGLRQRSSWAPTLGLGARSLAVLSATPVFFVGAGAGPMTGAAISIVLSLVAAVLLIAAQREQRVTETRAPLTYGRTPDGARRSG